MAGGDRHQRHRRLQLYPGGGRPDARPALWQDREHREPPGVSAGLRHRQLRGQQGGPDRTHPFGRRGSGSVQHQRQRRRPRIRQDGPTVHAATRGARARRARIGPGAGGRAGGRGAGHRVPVQRRCAPHHGTGHRGGWRADARFLKIRGAHTILRAVTNPLKNKHLKALALVALLACGGKPQEVTPEPTAPLPTAGIAAQQVGVLPLTLVAAEDSLHWEAVLGERRTALAKSDSIIGTLLKTRAPEVSWLLPDELRRVARRAPGIAPAPDQMGTAILFHPTKQQPEMVADPLRSELRTLAALAGGGRYALVPAGLTFRRKSQPPTAPPSRPPTGTAEPTGGRGGRGTRRGGVPPAARGGAGEPWGAPTPAVQ